MGGKSMIISKRNFKKRAMSNLSLNFSHKTLQSPIIRNDQVIITIILNCAGHLWPINRHPSLIPVIQRFQKNFVFPVRATQLNWFKRQLSFHLSPHSWHLSPVTSHQLPVCFTQKLSPDTHLLSSVTYQLSPDTPYLSTDTRLFSRVLPDSTPPPPSG